MGVTALPWRGSLQADRRGPARSVRVATHPDLGLIVLSLWRDDVCVATHQMVAEDGPRLIDLLKDALCALAAPVDDESDQG
jgi:hypothetical protein